MCGFLPAGILCNLPATPRKETLLASIFLFCLFSKQPSADFFFGLFLYPAQAIIHKKNLIQIFSLRALCFLTSVVSLPEINMSNCVFHFKMEIILN